MADPHSLCKSVARCGGFGWPGHNRSSGDVGGELIEQRVARATANNVDHFEFATGQKLRAIREPACTARPSCAR